MNVFINACISCVYFQAKLTSKLVQVIGVLLMIHGLTSFLQTDSLYNLLHAYLLLTRSRALCNNSQGYMNKNTNIFP